MAILWFFDYLNEYKRSLRLAIDLHCKRNSLEDNIVDVPNEVSLNYYKEPQPEFQLGPQDVTKLEPMDSTRLQCQQFKQL